MQDLRVKNQFTEHKELKAAQGVKIAAKELEKTIAGLSLRVANSPDEVDILKEEAERDLSSALNAIKLKPLGVFVQASTLGSLEALLEFLKTSKIPYAGLHQISDTFWKLINPINFRREDRSSCEERCDASKYHVGARAEVRRNPRLRRQD